MDTNPLFVGIVLLFLSLVVMAASPSAAQKAPGGVVWTKEGGVSTGNIQDYLASHPQAIACGGSSG